MKTTAERTRQVIADVAGCSIEQAADGKNLVNDLYFDSLDQIDLCMQIENEFYIEINDDEFDSCNTVAQIVALVESKVKP